MDFTPEQIKVIDSRNQNLIVSAAAGSGKTAVLTERIVKKICEDENLNVDRMLIVTFTNSAAREMKERIGKKLREKLAEKPDDAHLKTISKKSVSTRRLQSAVKERLRRFRKKLLTRFWKRHLKRAKKNS